MRVDKLQRELERIGQPAAPRVKPAGARQVTR